MMSSSVDVGSNVGSNVGSKLKRHFHENKNTFIFNWLVVAGEFMP